MSPQGQPAEPDDLEMDGYEESIERIRAEEYPMLKDAVYLDHAGTTLYAKSLIDRFSQSMMSDLLGNPHSASASSQLSTRRVDDIRLRVLQFFNADPDDFDVVFVANATAGVRLVVEAFRDNVPSATPGGSSGFWYGYHKDSHTSLVGVRETASLGHRCFVSDDEVEEWLSGKADDVGKSLSQTKNGLGLFSYPAQSNFNGRRLPLSWSSRLRSSRHSSHENIFTLLDAAALVSTSTLNLKDASSAPDFTVLSFYKIFGFPDLGALIVRKETGHVLRKRRYFGGGTVDMAVCLKEAWHEKKSQSLHDHLEDGTLPIHNIVALGAALDVHRELFGSMDQVAKYTARLAANLYAELSGLRHGNGEQLCKLYHGEPSDHADTGSQGPVVAFNIRNSKGAWVSNAEVEKLATIKNIHIRTGGLCNPGGVASSLNLAPWEMKRNFSAGQRCGNDEDIMGGKPTGVIRASLGAMSTRRDVTSFVDFIRDNFLEETNIEEVEPSQDHQLRHGHDADFRIESLMVYPIKSCGGWRVPPLTAWDIKEEGLAWDREWCIVHLGTGVALSQKKYPKMALIRPSIDLAKGVLRIRSLCSPSLGSNHPRTIELPLSADPSIYQADMDTYGVRSRSSRVCGDTVDARLYTSSDMSEFFTAAIGAPCTLARFPPGGSGSNLRHSKLHLQQSTDTQSPYLHAPGQRRQGAEVKTPILLSNESPILVISRSSLNRLNEEIKMSGGKAARAEVFRANIIVSEDTRLRSGNEYPYIEDTWRYLQIGPHLFEMLGPCRRCQMVCVDQNTAEINQEPFITLARTRRKGGNVYFGQHSCHVRVPRGLDGSHHAQTPTIMAGDTVRGLLNDEEFP